MQRRDKIKKLLKGIETGDPEAVSVVNEDKYIQHNPQTHEGGEGLAALFKRISQTSPRVNIVRAFEDGDFVFAHTEYDFATRKIGFEVFRFEGEQAVEHWDNIQERKGPNLAGHSMVDGATDLRDLHKREENRDLARSFVEQVFIKRASEKHSEFIDEADFIDHAPELGIQEKLEVYQYTRIHRVLAEGNFVLVVSEGVRESKTIALYDMFRIHDGKIVEHWDTIERVPPREEWKNSNGKF